MVKKRDNRLATLYAVTGLLLVLVLFALDHRITGNAVSEQDVILAQSLAGDWDVDITFITTGCDNNPNTFTSFTLPISASGSGVTLFYPSLQFELVEGTLTQDQTVLRGSFLNGKFAFTEKPVIKTQPPHSGPGEITYNYFELSPSTDCNSFNVKSDWTWMGPDDTCSGKIEMTATKKVANGCFKPECKENWVCSDWGNCTNGTQLKTCTDGNSCGTVKSKPVETQACAMPAPVKADYTWLMILAALLVIATIGAAAFIIYEKKKKSAAKKLYQLIKNIRGLILLGDANGAFNGYNALREQFVASQDALSSEDASKIYQESVNLQRDIGAMNSPLPVQGNAI